MFNEVTMASRKISNPLALAVLALLAERPTHPYEMDFLMRARGITESINLKRGSLYTVVEALQRDGLIVPQETRREGKRPERTIYALTEAGRAKFDGWLRELLRKPVHEYAQFTAGLTFLAHIRPPEVIALFEERARSLEAEIDEMRFRISSVAERLGVPRLFLIETEFALAQREAELQWVRAIIREIEAGTLTWPTFIASMSSVAPRDDMNPEPTTTMSAATHGENGGEPVQ